MFCRNCGFEINNESAFCSRCGCPVQEPVAVSTEQENPTISILAMIFAFVAPIAGLILSIIGMSQYKDERLKKRCTTSLICSIVVPIACVILYFMFVFVLFFFIGMMA